MMEQKLTSVIVAAIRKTQKLIHAGKLDKAEVACRKILKKHPDKCQVAGGRKKEN